MTRREASICVLMKAPNFTHSRLCDENMIVGVERLECVMFLLSETRDGLSPSVVTIHHRCETKKSLHCTMSLMTKNMETTREEKNENEKRLSVKWNGLRCLQ